MSRATISSGVMPKPLSRPRRWRHAFSTAAPLVRAAPNPRHVRKHRMAKESWWQRLNAGLKRTSAAITGAISDLAVKRKLDAAMIEEIEEVLIRADLGVDLSATIAAAIAEGRFDKAITADEVKAVLAAEVEKVLEP